MLLSSSGLFMLIIINVMRIWCHISYYKQLTYYWFFKNLIIQAHLELVIINTKRPDHENNINHYFGVQFLSVKVFFVSKDGIEMLSRIAYCIHNILSNILEKLAYVEPKTFYFFWIINAEWLYFHCSQLNRILLSIWSMRWSKELI